ncbi:hypothetical protein EMIHUDRAFT_195925 [Emiliania huxleyi CCMP1516]|uniref:Uncharacterized protein n=2 Tax=Emiliania huxleyi TaxID=2903 RepID=A0A0D3J360_EMIH1|nr:hypothetical protein EMIHUDRAFT_195925 [Emiliania huxleyi CCMP1516]EOD17945.1 hypothetical protein EMIHUDRAFT_195925 [Emiliania huxleyi CCMP1516]|eukprot:XP_005770374.1 hypothetical protein EMIHUDRAFT_195925 [Emiliania huxleyi CCMP1516]
MKLAADIPTAAPHANVIFVNCIPNNLTAGDFIEINNTVYQIESLEIILEIVTSRRLLETVVVAGIPDGSVAIKLTADVTEPAGQGVAVTTVTAPPHLHFAHGGRADFRGEDGRYYSFFSAPNLAVNVKTEDAVFEMHRKLGHTLTVHGSFITEVEDCQRIVRQRFDESPLQAGPGRPSEMRLDVSFHAKDNAASRSLPHGLVGQSFSSTASRWGNVDEYPAEGHFTTAAMAEGAIEGEAAMYEVAAADATSFAFSRFDAQEITGPVDLRLASAVDATSTDEAFTST